MRYFGDSLCVFGLVSVLAEFRVCRVCVSTQEAMELVRLNESPGLKGVLYIFVDDP